MKTFIGLARIVNEFPKEWKETKKMVLKYGLDISKSTK